MKRKTLRILLCAAAMMLMVTVTAVPAFAAGDVAGAIEQTWNTAKSQIQTVVNNVVFPVVDMILAILFFVKVGRAISSTESTGSLNLPRPASCLRA